MECHRQYEIAHKPERASKLATSTLKDTRVYRVRQVPERLAQIDTADTDEPKKTSERINPEMPSNI